MSTLDRILELLKTQNVEQQEFAKAIGIGKQAISEWKSGKTKSYMRHIDKIATFFGVSTDYLLGQGEKKTAPEGQPLSELFSDLSEDELSKVIEYVDFLKSKRNS